MINVIKVDLYGHILEKGVIVHGLFVDSYSKKPKVVFPINNRYIIAMDNEQCIYIVDSGISVSNGKISSVGSSSVSYSYSYSDKDKFERIGDAYFTYSTDYNEKGKISRIGNTYVYYEHNSYYESKGKIRLIDNLYVFYWPTGDDFGKVKCVGDTYFYYYPSYATEKGNIKTAGNISIYYDGYGRVTQIGNYRI